MNEELSIACLNGNTQKVKKLINKGADIDESKAFGSASKGKRWNIVKYLSKVKRSMYVPKNFNTQKNQLEEALRFMNDRNENEDSFLIKACEEGDYNTAKVLIELGVDVNQVGDEGHTPLMEAVMWQRTKIVKLLLEVGADKEQLDEKGKSILQMAFETGNREIYKLISSTQ